MIIEKLHRHLYCYKERKQRSGRLPDEQTVQGPTREIRYGKYIDL